MNGVTGLLLCLLASPALGSSARLGFYQGNGTSHPHHNDGFYAVLTEAAATATGGPHNYALTNLTERDVADLRRDDFDAVIFPGGSGNGQATAIGAAGISALRDFVKQGGGYIGTCGGAFLGLQHVLFFGEGPSGRGPPTQEPFDRGHGPVLVQFTDLGVRQLKLPQPTFSRNLTITYWQGPIVKPDMLPSNVTVLSTFRTEIHSRHTNQTRGEMINTPAMTSLDGYGAGRVVLNSPHPELSPQIPEIYARELAWVLRR